MHQSGQGMVEYALILVLVAVVVIVALVLLGPLTLLVIPAVICLGLVGLIIAIVWYFWFRTHRTPGDRGSADHKGPRGQGMIEYALVMVLVAIVVIAALTILTPVISAALLGDITSKIILIATGIAILVSVGSMIYFSLKDKSLFEKETPKDENVSDDDPSI